MARSHHPKVSVALLSLACAAYAAGCASGRLGSEEREIEQGREAAKTVEEEIGLVDDPQLAAYVDAIGQRLVAHSTRQSIEYQFHVVDMAVPNAFALPGGHIYVSRGLLALANSEDELATVIGHEIGHVAARHSVHREVANVPLIPIRIAAGLGGAAASIVSPTLGRVIAGTGHLPGALALAKYGREQEREADRLGQDMAAAAGWDPAALGSIMHTLARETELHGEDPERQSFFASHPTSPDRSRESAEYAATLERAPANRVAPTHADFLARIAGVVVGESAAGGVFVDNRFLQPELDVALSFPRDWELTNTPAAVIAQRKDEKAVIVVQLAGEGTDAMQAARAFVDEHRVRGTPRAIDVGGLRGAQLELETGGWRDRQRIHLTWVASGGLVYEIAGVAGEEHYASARGRFSDTAQSFHRLTDAERAEIEEARLRIVEARAGERLADLGARAKDRWKPEEAAVANGIEPDTRLAAGALVKIARPEAYVAKPKQAPKEARQTDATASGG